MIIGWDFTAQTYLDQLRPQEQERVVSAVAQLPASWEILEGTQLLPVQGSTNDLFSLRVGSDLLVLLERQGNTVNVVDVVRWSQIKGLRDLEKRHLAPAG